MNRKKGIEMREPTDDDIMQLAKLRYGGWFEVLVHPPNECSHMEDSQEFLAWECATPLLTVAYWSKEAGKYLDANREGVEVNPDFWMPIFTPDHPIFEGEFLRPWNEETDGPLPAIETFVRKTVEA